ncbi:DUF4926 domain-containing protein [Cohnella yongneupensis]|uniref:DUF4926 domain-containing protein n=1 Tax=Cohnella yongneupensis TaxID=425006 RepID=A0ABW0R4Z8_9BACL
MKMYDVIRMTKDYPEEKLVKGQIGTILEIYNADNFEVEFCDDNGFTIYLGTLSKEWFELLD